MNHKKKNIFFSVIICCYNSYKYIGETLNSIINQTYKHRQIIIVYDGSLDDTKIIMDKYKIENKYIIHIIYKYNEIYSYVFNVEKC